MDLDLNSRRLQREHDARTQVLLFVDGRNREIALLVAGPVGQIGLATVLPGVPDPFFRVDVVITLVRVLIEAHRVEDVELGLRSPVRGRRHAALHQVLLGFAGHIARIPAIGLEGDRIHHVADQRQRGDLETRVHERG